MNRFAFAVAALAGVTFAATTSASANNRASLEAMARQHAAANGVPFSLVHRVIMRESHYRPRAVSKGNYGIMQIRLGTARGMGYSGGAAGLLDPNTNMTYAVKYLAGAYKVAGGNESRAVQLYASGYHHAAKRRGMTQFTNARPRQQPRTQEIAAFNTFEGPAAATSVQPRRTRATRNTRRQAAATQQVAWNPFQGVLVTPQQQQVKKAKKPRRSAR